MSDDIEALRETWANPDWPALFRAVGGHVCGVINPSPEARAAIAAAPEHIALLLAHIDELRAERDEARALLGGKWPRRHITGRELFDEYLRERGAGPCGYSWDDLGAREKAYWKKRARIQSDTPEIVKLRFANSRNHERAEAAESRVARLEGVMRRVLGELGAFGGFDPRDRIRAAQKRLLAALDTETPTEEGAD